MLPLGALRAQTASSCVAPDTLRLTHDRDARDMAVRRMYETHSPDTVHIEAPQAQVDTIMRGLAAIYNLDTALQADSVFKYWCIHTYRGVNSRRYSAYLDTSYIWAKYWHLSHPYSGYYDLDQFLYIHGFSLTSQHYIWGMNEVTFTTTHRLNGKAFADSLALFPGVVEVYEEYEVGFGNFIRYVDSTNTYMFVKGWGDCPAGCTSGKTWTYKVDDTCGVTLSYVFRSGSDPYPPFPDCTYRAPEPSQPPTLQVGSVPSIGSVSVYPNPVANVLHIEMQGTTVGARFTMTDILGRAVAMGPLFDRVVIGMAHLPAGVYMVRVENGNEWVQYAKVIKQ